MKTYIAGFLLLLLLLTGCSAQLKPSADIAATTGPVAQFAEAVTAGSGLVVSQVIRDNVSCLHDYTLSVRQMEVLEAADVVIISGAGLEEMMQDVLSEKNIVDCSEQVALLEADTHEVHDDHGHDHHHEHDPHTWLDPLRAVSMVQTLTEGLCRQYPQHEPLFRTNAEALVQRLEALDAYASDSLQNLSCRKLITFHDGFSYLADRYDLDILASMEEEAGSEASARDLTSIVHLIDSHQLPAVFTEVNGSPSAASIVCRETGCRSFALDMALGGSDYFEAMTANIDALKEAL